MMKRFLALALLLAAVPAAAEETITCGEMATRLDGMVKDMREYEAAGNKVGAAVNQGLLNNQGRLFREQCVDPYVCDEAAGQLFQ